MGLLTPNIGLLFWLLTVGLLVLVAPIIIFIFVVKYIHNKDKKEIEKKN